MKLKRNKNIKRDIDFYRINYNFESPLKVVIDGTFLKKDLDINYNFKPKFQKLIKSKCIFYTTDCILNELKNIGNIVEYVYLNALTLNILKCEHNDYIKKDNETNNTTILTGSECINKHIGIKNYNKYIVCTQDKNLINILKDKIKTPVLHFFNENQLNIVEMSLATKNNFKKQINKKYLSNNTEYILQKKKQEIIKEEKEKIKSKQKKEINKLLIRKKKVKLN